MTTADQLIAAAARVAETERADVPETQLLVAAACDWARLNGEAVAAAAAMAGPLVGAQRRAARHELRRREAALRKSILDARGVPLWWRLCSLFAPPPWNTVLAIVAWLVPWLIERWSQQPLELSSLAHAPGA